MSMCLIMRLIVQQVWGSPRRRSELGNHRRKYGGQQPSPPYFRRRFSSFPRQRALADPSNSGFPRASIPSFTHRPVTQNTLSKLFRKAVFSQGDRQLASRGGCHSKTTNTAGRGGLTPPRFGTTAPPPGPLVLCACVILRGKAGYYKSVMLRKHVTRSFRV